MEPEKRLRPPVLEDQDQDPVGGPHREQIESDRFQRHDDRAESDEQKQEGECEHERDYVRHAVLHLVREVDVIGDVTSHGRLDLRDTPEGLRYELISQGRDRLPTGGLATGARKRELDRCRRSVRASAHREGRMRESAKLLASASKRSSASRAAVCLSSGPATTTIAGADVLGNSARLAQGCEGGLALSRQRLAARSCDVQLNRRRRKRKQKPGREHA